MQNAMFFIGKRGSLSKMHGRGALISPCTIFNPLAGLLSKLRLRKNQINLVFHSACITFASETNKKTYNTMKKFAIAIIAALAFSAIMPAHAQFALGIKGGVNLVSNDVTGLTTMKKEDFLNKDSYTGFFIGPKAEVDIPFTGLGLEVAALYSQKGMAISTDETYKLNSVLIPVNVRLGFGLGNLLKIFIAGGPEFDFNIGDNLNFVTGSKEEGIVAYAVNKSALSVNVGVGATVLKHLQLGVNYNIPWGNTAEVVAFSKGEIQEIEAKEGEVSTSKTLLEQYEELRTKYDAAYASANKTVDDITAKVKAGTLQLSVAYLF